MFSHFQTTMGIWASFNVFVAVVGLLFLALYLVLRKVRL